MSETTPEQPPVQVDRTTITVLGKNVRFPPICPHCLREADVPLRLESEGRSSYIVVGVVRHYHTIHALFCRPFARQVIRLNRLRIAGFILAIAIVIVADVYFGITGTQAFLIGIVVGGTPLLIQHMLRNPNKYIRIVAVGADSIEFSIPNPTYAKAFRKLNSSEKA